MNEERYYKRDVDRLLLDWKKDKRHKPLLVRGARQVGKSSAVRHLGKSFKHFIEVNLEKRNDVASLFETTTDVKTLCSQLSAIYGKPIIAEETLLFIDEIQESEKAISMLRYFYEDFQELHVIAAGSLLEFTLREIHSFGVGRIRSLFMQPFSFDEFLTASGYEKLVEYKQSQASAENPLPEAMRNELIKQLKTFYLVGGMPQAVSIWIETQNYSECSAIHHDIIDTYKDDFGKYSSKVSPLLLTQTLHSVALQAGNKFVFSKIGSVTDSRKAHEALDLLSLAGLIIPVTHTAANGMPLGAEINPKFTKYLFLDVGLMQTLLGMNPSDVLLASDIDFVNKGGLSEMFVGTELIKYESQIKRPELFYWEKIVNKSRAEVDYVISINGRIFPIEVKASTSGSMQSMREFLRLKKLGTGLRVSLENFCRYQDITVIPLYAISNYTKMIST